MTTTDTTVSIPAGMLRGALMHAAKRDVRYYLNGVYIDLARGCIVATDGHRMYVGRLPVHVRPVGPAPDGFIVPRDELETALKLHKARNGRKSDETDFIITTTGCRVSMEGVIATTVDGRFPEYERVIPRELSGVVAALNPEYVCDALAALHASGASRKRTMPSIAYNGEGAAIITASECTDAFVVVMPGRDLMRPAADVLATIAHVLRAPAPAPAQAQADAPAGAQAAEAA